MTESVHRSLRIEGARQHNLAGFGAEIPLREILAITGPSGSGRRSFVFSTIHAESRRRYLETFSSATRRRLETSPRPQFDRVEGIPLTVSIRTDSLAAGPRNTVAMATGILPLLASLFARFARPYCATCRHEVSRWTSADIVDSLRDLPAGTRLMLGFTFREPITISDAAEWLRKAGFTRAISNGSLVPLEELAHAAGPLPTDGLPVIVDRLKSDTDAGRIRESVELCFRGGRQDCFLLIDDASAAQSTSIDLDGKTWMRRNYHSSFVCDTCHAVFPDPVPERFQFTSPLGACATCRGIGSTRISRSTARELCSECRGQRFAKETLAFRLNERSLSEWLSLSLGEFRDQLHEGSFDGLPPGLIAPLKRRADVAARLHLGALRLTESVSSLSPSERRRMALGQALVTPLTGALYLIDSVTTGIPPQEIADVVSPLRELVDRGASVWVIDDHPAVIEAADRVLEFGPGAGAEGGRIVSLGRFSPEPEIATPSTNENARSKGPALEFRDPELGMTWRLPLGGVTVLSGASERRPHQFVATKLLPALRGEDETSGAALEIVSGVAPEEVIVIAAELRRPHPRAHVLAAIQAFSSVRSLFADIPEARRRNLGASHFSPHNAAGLRCPECEGIGRIAVDLQHLPDLEVVCPECFGTRYQSTIGEIRFRGLSLVELLDLTVDEAFRFFKGHPPIQRRLQMLRELRLQYLRLGQPLSQLSLGEQCRLRMAQEFARVSQARRLLIIEEPTLGLSRSEVTQLAAVCRQVAVSGGTLLLVDAHPELIAAADAVINLR